MKPFLSLFLAFTMLLTLCACGDTKQDEILFTEVSSVDEVNQQLGYKMLTIDSKDDAITWATAAFRSASDASSNDAVGQLTYVSMHSTITLRMTMDEARGTGLAGYTNAGLAGSVDAPASSFSDLNIYVIHSDLFFCEFSFTSEKSTCYLSLSKNNTDLDSYSKLLIDFVNQLYNMTETPDFALQEQRKSDTAAQKKAAAEAQQNAAAEAPVKEETANTEQTQTGNATQTTPEVTAPTDTTTDTAETPVETPTEEVTPTGSITLEYYDMTFKVGEGWTLHPTGGKEPYKWSSANTAIATVTDGGTINAVSAGETTLTCTSSDGLTANVIVRVKAG